MDPMGIYTLEVQPPFFLEVGLGTTIFSSRGFYHHPKGTTIILTVVDFQGTCMIKNTIHVGNYTVRPMDPMKFVWLSLRCPDPLGPKWTM